VCGEFVSPESLRLLESLLDQNPFAVHPEIGSARVFLGNKMITLPLSPPARSISRFELDAALIQSALHCGVRVEQGSAAQQVGRDDGNDGMFSVRTVTDSFRALAVVNATGRWSQLTQYPTGGQSKWIGLKAHYHEFVPDGSVDLYFFPGGYCGVQPVGKHAVNAAAMVRADSARSLEEVFAAHPALWRRSRDWEPVFPAITTSPLYFRAPETENQGVMLAGDAAAFIDPFAGDGISLALQSGTLAAESLTGFFASHISLAESHQRYQAAYVKRFSPAFRNAARLRAVLCAPRWLRSALMRLVASPFVARRIVRCTRAR
jgi:flavin-dependent dehydrogenase